MFLNRNSIVKLVQHILQENSKASFSFEASCQVAIIKLGEVRERLGARLPAVEAKAVVLVSGIWLDGWNIGVGLFLMLNLGRLIFSVNVVKFDQKYY